ncbi:MAG: hypothetical protein IPN10_14915 [Saprospiraceae bacterium]|nr:hypothetical protein [Saprospiraceae bacterium]
MEFNEINSLFSSDKNNTFKDLFDISPCSKLKHEEQTLQTAIRLKKPIKYMYSGQVSGNRESDQVLLKELVRSVCPGCRKLPGNRTSRNGGSC